MAAAGIDRSVEAAARRPGRAEVVLRTSACELRTQERVAAQARASRAPARIAALTAACVLPAVLCLMAGPAALAAVG